MSKGAAIAVGAAVGVAFGASNGNLAMSLAIGATAGALLEWVVHAVQLARRKRENPTSQP